LVPAPPFRGFSKIPLFVIANTAGCPQVPLTCRQKEQKGISHEE